MLAVCFLLNISLAWPTSAGQLVDCAEVRAGDSEVATAMLSTATNSFFMLPSFLVSLGLGPNARPIAPRELGAPAGSLSFLRSIRIDATDGCRGSASRRLGQETRQINTLGRYQASLPAPRAGRFARYPYDKLPERAPGKSLHSRTLPTRAGPLLEGSRPPLLGSAMYEAGRRPVIRGHAAHYANGWRHEVLDVPAERRYTEPHHSLHHGHPDHRERSTVPLPVGAPGIGVDGGDPGHA